jgi:GT2 family glycosyltransferase/glycosyltransferase involved in cell wall biosynthesis
VLSALLRSVGRVTTGAGAEPAEAEPVAPIRLPWFEHPLVSVVVSMHASGAVGERALRAIALNSAGIPFELIVVDDRADEATRRVIGALENATVIENSENLGFTRSNNRAAAAARGKYLVLLNDDTEVREGWLEALVECADSDSRIAWVGAKLIYPDGRLQEAGSIVWRDATGWNFGRGDAAERPQYNYRREVDYASAAAALVRTEAWREIGGFDERFAPAYYEDADACFALRDRGWRVVYEPRAVVVHHEGYSHGTGHTDARGKRNQELNRGRFMDKWRSVLEAEHEPAWPATEPRDVADRNRGEHVLVIDHHVPMPDRDSGSLRMFELLRALRERGCRVSFLPDNLLAEQPYTGWMQSFGVEVLHAPVYVPEELDRLRHAPLAIVSRPQIAARYLDMIRERMPDTLVAYDTVDLHYLRERRRAELGEGHASKAEALREIELALIRACDATIVITGDEREHVRAEVPHADVRLVPNANDVAAEVPPAAGREGLLFVGSFQHTPNLDAAGVLVREVMPLVWRELPECRLTIVGPHAPPEVEALASARVTVAGWVADMTPLLDGSRAMVAPLRYGAGMKGKVTQSLAAGLPVVTTGIGAEGLDVDPGEQMLVAETPEEIAAEVVRVCRDDELWQRLSDGGLAAAQAGWSRDAMRARVDELVELALDSAGRSVVD